MRSGGSGLYVLRAPPQVRVSRNAFSLDMAYMDVGHSEAETITPRPWMAVPQVLRYSAKTGFARVRAQSLYSLRARAPQPHHPATAASAS